MDPASPKSPLDEGEFDDGYDENLMGDEEDKRMLAQMTEKQREQELFNRSERRETLRIRFEIERKLKTKAKKRELEKNKQSKQIRGRKRLRASEIYSSDESSEESDEYTPESNINTDASNQAGVKKMVTRSALLTSSSESSVSSASSASSESESEQGLDQDQAEDNSQEIQDDFQMTLADLRTMQLKRNQIEKWVYTRFFNETAIGLFVKISVGNHPQTKDHMYKVAQITDITKNSNPYVLNIETRNKTDKYCVVKIGRVERTYKMSFISNRSFDEDDYNKWKDQIHLDGQDMPSRDYFNKKRRDIDRAINYDYKDEDIQYEIQEKKKFRDLPHNFAVRKTELLGMKGEAEAANDFIRAQEIQKEIDELEERTRNLEKDRSSSTFSAISIVNERNRKKNIVESEKALKESKSVKTEDPFTRRKCTPTIVHNKNLNTTNNGDASNQSDKDGKASMNVKTSNGLQAKTEVMKSVDDLCQAHASIDLELDIDI